MGVKRIIVEGVDGSGKTSLVNQIRDWVPRVRYITSFKRSGEADYWSWLYKELTTAPSRTVKLHDRFVYSEIIYGSILRDRVDIPDGQVPFILQELRENALLIYCRIPYPHLMETVKKEAQMEGVHDNLMQLVDAYDMIMMDERPFYGDRFWTWNFALNNFEQLKDIIIGYVNSH